MALGCAQSRAAAHSRKCFLLMFDKLGVAATRSSAIFSPQLSTTSDLSVFFISPHSSDASALRIQPLHLYCVHLESGLSQYVLDAYDFFPPLGH